MKHKGKASRAARRLMVGSLILVLVIIAVGFLATIVGSIITTLAVGMLGVWILFAAFTLYFFRDPTAKVPAEKNIVVAPAHGTIDFVDDFAENIVMGGPCKRISIFLNVFNVHVQQAPVSGKITYLQHTSGLFLNAMKSDSATHNENVLIGFQPAENPNDKIGVRLIAGLIARRIIPWIEVGEDVSIGERISLVQFGSRADLYLPLRYKIRAKIGDKTVGGETIVATTQ